MLVFQARLFRETPSNSATVPATVFLAPTRSAGMPDKDFFLFILCGSYSDENDMNEIYVSVLNSPRRVRPVLDLSMGSLSAFSADTLSRLLLLSRLFPAVFQRFSRLLSSPSSFDNIDSLTIQSHFCSLLGMFPSVFRYLAGRYFCCFPSPSETCPSWSANSSPFFFRLTNYSIHN